MSSVVGLTELLTVTVTPAPGSVQDTNLTEVAGTAVATGVGVSDAGTQRVALSSDSTVNIAESSTAITGSLAANGILFTTETLGANTISIQLSGDWQALCTFQVSNDGVYWANVQGYTFNNYMNSTNTAQDNGVYIFPVTGRYFQVVVSNYKSGTIATVSYLRQQSLAGIGETMLTQAMDQANGTPINVGFQGFQGPGQQNAANSLPVALPNEQVLDKHFFGKAYINANVPINANILLDAASATNNSAAPLDCLQYRSIYFQYSSTAAPNGNLAFEASNDLVNWMSVSLVRLSGGAVVGISESVNFNPINVGATGIYGGSLMFRYFRVRATAAMTNTGTLQFSTMLRMTPFTYLTEAYTNIVQQNSTGLASGATMKNAAVLPETYSPLIFGGTDRSIVRSELLGAAGAGGIAQNYLTNGPYARNAYFDLSGSMGVAGPQPFLAEDKTYPVNVRLERSTNGQESVQDLLQKLLIEMRAHNYYLRELPAATALLCQSASPLTSGASSMQDEPDSFYNDKFSSN